MGSLDEESPKYTPEYAKVEKWGSCLAHASGLVAGVPLIVFLGFPLAFLPCPVIAYMISRSFRRRSLAWGAAQAMQAAAVQLLILLLAGGTAVSGSVHQLALIFVTAAFLLFLYSLWGALDTLLGYDFRYLYIGNLLDRVSQVNLSRREPRRRWQFGRRPDGSDRRD